MNVFKQYITLLHWIPHLWKASKFDKIRDKYCIRYLIKLSDLVIIYLLFFAFARTFIESREGMFNRFAKRVRNSIDSEKFGFVSACNIDRTLEKSRSAKTRCFETGTHAARQMESEGAKVRDSRSEHESSDIGHASRTS